MSEQLDENAKLIEQFHKLEENRRHEKILEAELESVRKRLECVRLDIRRGESVNKIVDGIAIKYSETWNMYGGYDIKIETSSDELARGANIYVNANDATLRGIDLEAWGASKFHNALPGSFSSGYYRSKNIGSNYTEEAAKNIAMQWVLHGLIYNK